MGPKIVPSLDPKTEEGLYSSNVQIMRSLMVCDLNAVICTSSRLNWPGSTLSKPEKIGEP